MISAVINTNDSAGTCVLLHTPTAVDDASDWVSRAAEEQGFIVTSPYATLAPGASLLDSISLAVSHAAIVVAMVNDRTNERRRYSGAENASLWFELGIAVATRRPVLVVLGGDDVALPAWASELQTVGPGVDYEGFSRAMRQASRRAVNSSEPNLTKTGVPLGAATIDLETTLLAMPQTPGGGGSGPAFERWFSELLRSAEVPFEQSSSVGDKDLPSAYNRIDFVVSADELTANLGDPFPVELALGQADKIIRGRRKTFRAYLKATEANAVLVVSATTAQPTTIWSIGTGDVLACSALTLLRAMQAATFGEAVLAIRNSAGIEADGK